MKRLIIRPGAIGDCVLALPALESLLADETEIWVAEQNVPLIRFGARVRSIGSTGLDLLGLPDVDPPRPLLETLSGFDSIVSWYGESRPDFREAADRAGLPFVFFPALPRAGCLEHAADFFLRQAVGAGGRQVPAVPRIEVPRGDPRPPVIHPFSGSPVKNWPLERFASLKARIGAEWCAGPEEELAGALRIGNLYDLSCRLGRARAYIGNDSGITHLAAAAGAPVVALFGPTDPGVWAPRGPRVRILTAGPPGARMELISLEDVLTAVESLW